MKISIEIAKLELLLCKSGDRKWMRQQVDEVLVRAKSEMPESTKQMLMTCLAVGYTLAIKELLDSTDPRHQTPRVVLSLVPKVSPDADLN